MTTSSEASEIVPPSAEGKTLANPEHPCYPFGDYQPEWHQRYWKEVECLREEGCKLPPPHSWDLWRDTCRAMVILLLQQRRKS